MFQIDVPRVDGKANANEQIITDGPDKGLIKPTLISESEGFSHSELYSPGSIFSIKPTTEAWCRKFAKARAQYQHDILPYIPEERQLGPDTSHADIEDE